MRTVVNTFDGVSVEFDTDICKFVIEHDGTTRSYDDYRVAEHHAKEKAIDINIARQFSSLSLRDKESLITIAYNDGYVFVCKGCNIKPIPFKTFATKSLQFIIYNLSIAYTRRNMTRMNDDLTLEEMISFFTSRQE